MSKTKDISGLRFGLLTVLRSHGLDKNGLVVWVCRCDCGNEHVACGSLLRSSRVKSCGCLKRSSAPRKTHGKTNTVEFWTWTRIKSRCANVSDKSYKDYGGRGISVSAHWVESFERFLEDMGERPIWASSIERIDNDGSYEPGNCKWSTYKEQNRNKRNVVLIDGMTKTEWAYALGITIQAVSYRVKRYGHPRGKENV